MAVHTSSIRLAIVDEERMLMGALGEWLNANAPDVTLAAAVTNWNELLAHPAFPVDVVVACTDCNRDDNLPVRLRSAARNNANVVLIASKPIPALLHELLPNGAKGFVAKTEPLDALLAAIHSAAAGRSYLSSSVAELLHSYVDPKLSSQERRVMQLYAAGNTVREVSAQLNISEETAKSYLKRIREKYRAIGIDAGTKVSLRRQAISEGLLSHAD